MKDVKKWANVNKMTQAEQREFAKFYYNQIANAGDQNKALDDLIDNFNKTSGFRSYVIPELRDQPSEHRDQIIEDVMDEDEPMVTHNAIKTKEEEHKKRKEEEHIQKIESILRRNPNLSKEQAEHISNVFDIIKKEPKLKADIKRSITEELAKAMQTCKQSDRGHVATRVTSKRQRISRPNPISTHSNAYSSPSIQYLFCNHMFLLCIIRGHQTQL